MAQGRWTIRASRAHRELRLVRAFVVAMLALVGYAGATTGAAGPAFGSLADFSLPQPAATLTRSGDKVIITGSVGDIFLSGSFSGPNRAEKQDRYRPPVDVMAMTRDFDGLRARLAALWNPGGSGTPEPVHEEPPTENEVIVVAAITPEVSTEALDAIDDAALGGAPLPRSQSQQLAYARADVPMTVFDGVLRDKQGRVVSDKELNCMATAIYFEARGESYRGQIAVGQVVLNRVRHRLYPDTICGVVYQNQHRRNACQFSFACDGRPERVTEAKAWAQAEEVARKVIAGDLYLTEVGYATHYHATYVYPHWAPRMTKVTKIGMHVFYHFKRGWKFG
ncbi:MAG TPA: cell wall hydrolase [Alphaproteobacteria bacterium]|nr:cell wall hydrolase [Alphaproteobacteria bacterium]